MEKSSLIDILGTPVMHNGRFSGVAALFGRRDVQAAFFISSLDLLKTPSTQHEFLLLIYKCLANVACSCLFADLHRRYEKKLLQKRFGMDPAEYRIETAPWVPPQIEKTPLMKNAVDSIKHWYAFRQTPMLLVGILSGITAPYMPKPAASTLLDIFSVALFPVIIRHISGQNRWERIKANRWQLQKRSETNNAKNRKAEAFQPT